MQLRADNSTTLDFLNLRQGGHQISVSNSDHAWTSITGKPQKNEWISEHSVLQLGIILLSVLELSDKVDAVQLQAEFPPKGRVNFIGKYYGG